MRRAKGLGKPSFTQFRDILNGTLNYPKLNIGCMPGDSFGSAVVTLGPSRVRYARYYEKQVNATNREITITENHGCPVNSLSIYYESLCLNDLRMKDDVTHLNCETALGTISAHEFRPLSSATQVHGLCPTDMARGASRHRDLP